MNLHFMIKALSSHVAAVGNCRRTGSSPKRRGILPRPQRFAADRLLRPGPATTSTAVCVARNLGKHIPGHPTIIPQNMPGAGSLRAAQYLYSVAPKDGSVIGTMSRSMPIEPLLGDAKFDGRQFTWIGNVADTNSLCASWHASGIKTWQDVLTKPFVLGGQGPGSDLDNFAIAGQERVRRQGQAGVRLSRRLRGQPRHRAPRDRRPLRLVVGFDQGHTAGMAARQEDQFARGVRAGEGRRHSARRAARPRQSPSEEQKQILRVHLAGQALGPAVRGAARHSG